MILRTETVEQVIDGEERATFVKDVIMTPGAQPLGMVRKRPVGEKRGAVLLVHGFGQNRYTWHSSRRSFANYLALAGWDVFNCDLRGHGRSRRFGAARPRIMYDYIESDLPAFAHEAMRLSDENRIVLIGHSMGGLISYAVAGTSLRDYTRGIITIASPYHFGQGSAFLGFLVELASAVGWTGLLDLPWTVPLRMLGQHMNKRQSWWDHGALPLPLRGWVPGGMEREVLSEVLSKAFEQTNLTIGLDIVRASSLKAFRSLDGMIDYSVAFEMLDRPLLVVAGTSDQVAPPESVRPAYESSRSRDKTYRAWPMGHLDIVLGRTATRTVWPLVRDWLALR